MRVLLVNQFYPPDPAATGQFLEDLAVALGQRGHQVRVLCSRQWYSEDREPKATGRSGAVEVVRLPAFGFGRRTRVGRALDYVSFFTTALTRGLLGPRPDIVICLTTPPYIGFVGSLLRVLRRARFVQWVMDVYPDAMVAHGMLKNPGMACRTLGWLSRRLMRRADLVWALGPYARNRILAYLAPDAADKVKVAPLWACASLRPGQSEGNPFRARYGGDGGFVVMYSGNMGLSHDFDTFLEGAGRLEKIPEIRFVFVGGGTRWVEVQDKACRAGLKNVAFHPYVPREHLRESLLAGDVHVLSQLPQWQGCTVPSKLAGILAIGRPAIFVGGLENEIAGWIGQAQAGYVVPVGDSAAFAAAVEALHGDVALRAQLGRNGRAFYEKHLAPDVSVSRLLDSIDHLMGRSPQGCTE